MSVMEILTEEFLAELPEDPQVAFGMVIRRVDGFLAQALERAESDNVWGHYEDAKYTAMNTLVAVARRFGIEPFASMQVPQRRQFGYEDFDDFKCDLDHYAAQLVLDNSMRAKRDSIEIEPRLKERLRQHVHGIKTLIDQSDMPEPRRAALHKKIADFEAALEKSRVNVALVAAILVGILSGTANVAQIADSAALGKLVSNIMTTLGQAKAVDQATRELPPAQPSQPLLPPRRPEPEINFGDSALGGPSSKAKSRETFTADLDDEIPF
jgi:hypothetical protein